MDTTEQHARVKTLFPNLHFKWMLFKDAFEKMQHWGPFRYTVQIMDTSRPKKRMIDLRTEARFKTKHAKIDPSNWKKNFEVLEHFHDHQEDWFNLIRMNHDLLLIFAHGCEGYIIVDVDDERDLKHPFIQRLIEKKYPFVLSPTKSLPKFIIPIVNEKMPPAVSTFEKRMTLKNKHGFHNTDFLANGFNFVPYDGILYNCEFNPEEMSIKDFEDIPYEMFSNSQRRGFEVVSPQGCEWGAESPALGCTDEQFEECLKLVATEKQNNDYPAWIRVLLIIKLYFPNDKGVHLSKMFSKLVGPKTYDDKKWIPFVGQDWLLFHNIKPDGKLTVGSLRYMAKITNPETYNRIFPPTIPSYDEMKMEFEQRNFKILNPVAYAEEQADGELILRKPAELWDARRNLRCSSSKHPQKGESFISLWRDDPTIRTFDAVDFFPGRPREYTDKGVHYYNLYTGRPYIEPVETDETVEAVFDLFIKLMRHLTGEDEESFVFFAKYVAHLIFKPDVKTFFILLFLSYEGAGKGLFWNFIGMNFIGEKYYCLTEKTDSVFGKFNPLASKKILLVLDEAKGSSTYDVMDCIKHMATEEYFIVNEKYKPEHRTRNFMNLVAVTNKKRSLKVASDDRRIVAFKAVNKEARTLTVDDYATIVKHKNNKAFIYRVEKFFQSMDLTTFDVHDPATRPQTNYYKMLRMTPLLIKFFGWFLYERRDAIFDDNVDIKRLHSRMEWFDHFRQFCEQANYNSRTVDVFTQEMLEFKNIFLFVYHKKKGNYWELDEKKLRDYCVLKDYELMVMTDEEET